MFWFDKWVDGRALADIWPELLHSTQNKEDKINELVGRITLISLGDTPMARILIDQINSLCDSGKDEKQWKLTTNGVYTVKSFYNFLNDGGHRCGWTHTILKGSCPKKINLFNWLARDNKILTLENLAQRRCNRLHSIMCVMCHEDIKSADHLLIQCSWLHTFGFSLASS